MPRIDIDALRADPEFQRLWVYHRDVAEAKLRKAEAFNAGAAGRTTLEIPRATPTAAPAVASKPTDLGTFSVPKPLPTSEVARRDKMSDEAVKLLRQAEFLRDFYNSKLKAKLEQGEISSMGQGMMYVRRPWARELGYEIDPDAETFMVQSGPFSINANAYYAASSGARGGPQAYAVMTVPHIPHPPGSLQEVTGIHVPFGGSEVPGVQYDLEAQGRELPNVIDYIKRQEAKKGVTDFSEWGGPPSPPKPGDPDFTGTPISGLSGTPASGTAARGAELLKKHGLE